MTFKQNKLSNSFNWNLLLFKNKIDVEYNTSQFIPAVTHNRILLLANFRTGSSFLGDVIQSAPNVFYSFEPLAYKRLAKTDLIKTIFECKLPAKYLQYIDGLRGDKPFMKRNYQGWSACQQNSTLCSHPNFVNAVCSSFSNHVIKVVRLRARELVDLLENDPTTRDWKIVYLFRDPRGTMSSRLRLQWCMKKTAIICRNVTRLCQDLVDDFQWFEKLKQKDPDHHFMLKFEDLSQNVNLAIENLFNFIKLPLSDSVKEFLEEHTRAQREELDDEQSEFSVARNTKQVANAWRSKMSKQRIASITDICRPALKLLDYQE